MEALFRSRYYLIFLSTIIGPLSTNSLIPIFEELRINFGLAVIAQVSLTIFVYILPFAIFQLFAGTFSDIVDKKKVVFLGFVIFISGLFLTLFSVLSKNFILFLVAFFIQGIGFSFINPTVMAILSDISPEEKKGFIMGVYAATGGIGVSIGGIIAGVLGNIQDGWRFLFLIIPIITIIAFIAFVIALKDCEVLVCRPLESEDNPNDTNDSIFSETLTKLKETLDIKIILFGMLGFFCFFSIITLSNTINEQIRVSIPSYNDQEVITYVSILLALGGIMGIIVSPIGGILLKKINPFFVLFIGFLLMLSIIFIPFGNTLEYFILVYLLVIIGGSLVWPALFKISMDVEKDQRGTSSAIINSLRFLGYSLVGPFYLFFGIPAVYLWVFGFCLIALGMIIYLKKIP